MSVREAVARRSLEVVRPTEQLVRLWWNRMRRELGFDVPSLRLLSVDIVKGREEWANTLWPGSIGPHLKFCDSPLTFKGFLTILVHELIHAILVYEDRHSEDDLHAAAFMEYRSVLKDRFGLPLDDSYGPEEMLPKRKGN